MQNTIDRIVKASSLPLSIVIVGVGNADFTKMVSDSLYIDIINYVLFIISMVYRSYNTHALHQS